MQGKSEKRHMENNSIDQTNRENRLLQLLLEIGEPGLR